MTKQEIREKHLYKNGLSVNKSPVGNQIQKAAYDAMDEYANQETAYWKKRCEAAEEFIAHSPCDPDITRDQIYAHDKWQELKNKQL